MNKSSSLVLTALICIFFLSSIPEAAAPPDTEQDTEEKIEALIAKMTPEEKFGQLNQLAGGGEPKEGDHPGITAEQAELIKKGLIGSFLGVNGAETTRKVQRLAVEESRLKIPLIFAHDVIHGYRTIFPIPLGEASSWDPELIRQAARVAAMEGSASGLHWTFAPMVDIARDARWGRIAEGSGEDPYLGSAMAAARVKGFQGNSLTEPGSLLACAKHFAAYGAAEAGRDYNTVDISERTLREIYLPPFQTAVQAGAGTLMSSFNEISGIPSTGNHYLLNTILRKEWGFKGFVVSDWTSVMEMQPHGVAKDRAAAGVLALNAGIDMDMESRIYVNDLPALYSKKQIDQSVVDEAVRRVLRMKFKLGLFDDPYRNSNPERERKYILHSDHRTLARKVAGKSIVLLKNEKQVLPLSKTVSALAVIGPLADDSKEILGTWHAFGDPKDAITVLQGIKQKVSPETKILYSKGCELLTDCGSAINEAEKAAMQADVAVIVAGETEGISGEAASRSNIDLPGKQEDLIRAIHKTGKPVVVVLMSGRPLTITWLAENVPAIVHAWQPGTEGGNAIADILFGDVNPSAKLPVSFPRNIGQLPIYYNHKNTGRPAEGKPDEKYTSKYLDVPNSPLYPFGFGLSYTTFEYENIRVNPEKINSTGTVIVTVDVKNTGNRQGEEVVQLYIQDQFASVTRPVKELKGFQKISISPGEKKTVTFKISPDQLKFYDQNMKFTAEPGIFNVYAGGNSRDVIQSQFEFVN